MDADAIAGMIFVLVILAITAGTIILFPVTLRLGRLLERRLEGNAGEDLALEVRELQARIQEIQRDVARIGERQAFTDSLLAVQNDLSVSGPRLDS